MDTDYYTNPNQKSKRGKAGSRLLFGRQKEARAFAAETVGASLQGEQEKPSPWSFLLEEVRMPIQAARP